MHFSEKAEFLFFFSTPLESGCASVIHELWDCLQTICLNVTFSDLLFDSILFRYVFFKSKLLTGHQWYPNVRQSFFCQHFPPSLTWNWAKVLANTVSVQFKTFALITWNTSHSYFQKTKKQTKSCGVWGSFPFFRDTWALKMEFCFWFSF